MEPFIVSARKYRPKTFKDVIGQQAITNTLLNAIEQNHLAQALLFCGPRGVGKTTCARILAKQINQDGEEHGEEDFAFNIFELDAASNNSVDDIRNLIEQVRIPPQVGKYKVYIIDEVHMLSQAAFNAFLKTLEEPPKHAIFILATTEKHKIIPTILSRCQIFDFKRITVRDAAEYLKYIAEEQGIEAEEDALLIIAQKADGAMRDALSIFDRVVSFAGKNLSRAVVTENLNVLDYETYFSMTDILLDKDIPKALVFFNDILAKGFEGHYFINGLASHFRDLMLCKHKETISLLDVGELTQRKYLEQAQKTSNSFLLKGIDLANTCDLNYKSSKNQRLLVELTLMKIASVEFTSEKKKSESQLGVGIGEINLIPTAYFKKLAPSKNGNSTPPQISNSFHGKENQTADVIEDAMEIQNSGVPEPVLKEEVLFETDKNITEIISKPETRINISPRVKKVSGLSLSSLKAKKEHELKKIEVVIDEDNLPKEVFEKETFMKLWNEYILQLNKDGKKIMASNLSSSEPELINETEVWLEMPNSTMKTEIEREQYPLLSFLRKKLNNYNIDLHIKVNEVLNKKYVYTPQEKYEKLREINPALEVLRKKFDLDI
ncbi:DNA polymerase III subunit gamma/tau [Eudoraea chungangensis]|uniref:DNA polymerase III subunit gamma/tau n=1 Tax=Eudoraea chungangensis TaxID=1481905 RepID=UPI0023EBF4C0|nr:DNA polymerase III subunit gamma/tau [Eudoraea chungangensis]